MGYNDFRQKYGLTAKPGAPSQADAGGPGEVVAPPAPADTPEPEVVAPPEPPRPRQVASADQARRVRDRVARSALGSNAAPTGPVEDSVGDSVEAPPPAPPAPASEGATPSPGGQPSLIEELNAQHMAQDPTPGFHVELTPAGQSSPADRNPLKAAAIERLVQDGMDPLDASARADELDNQGLREVVAHGARTLALQDYRRAIRDSHKPSPRRPATGASLSDVAGSMLRQTVKNMLLGDMSPEELRRLADEREQ